MFLEELHTLGGLCRVLQSVNCATVVYSKVAHGALDDRVELRQVASDLARQDMVHAQWHTQLARFLALVASKAPAVACPIGAQFASGDQQQSERGGREAVCSCNLCAPATAVVSVVTSEQVCAAGQAVVFAEGDAVVSGTVTSVKVSTGVATVATDAWTTQAVPISQLTLLHAAGTEGLALMSDGSVLPATVTAPATASEPQAISVEPREPAPTRETLAEPVSFEATCAQVLPSAACVCTSVAELSVMLADRMFTPLLGTRSCSTGTQAAASLMLCVCCDSATDTSAVLSRSRCVTGDRCST